MTELPPIRIGVLGAARIVPLAIAEPARRRPDVRLTAIAAREPARADEIAAQEGFACAAASYADLLARDDVEAYAAARVGYHRGLDRLRQNGWRGTAFVPGRHEPNRGFLRSLTALVVAAEAIGERDEAERCRLFIRQLDPAWPLPA